MVGNVILGNLFEGITIYYLSLKVFCKEEKTCPKMLQAPLNRL